MKVLQSLNVMECLVHWAAQFNSNIPAEFIEKSGLPQGEEQQSIQKLAAAHAVQIVSVRSLSLMASAQGIQRKISEMLRIVVVAGHEGVQPTGQPVER